LIDSISEKRDIPVNLDSITMQDDYEGDFTTRRALIYTLRFTAKTYLFGPLSTATKDIIKKSTVSLIAGDSSPISARSVVYSVEPRAIKNYTGIILTNLSKDINENDIIIEVNDASSISTNVYLDIEGESVFVKSKNANKLTVERGKDSTQITSHLSGAEIKSITETDNSLIESGDDFGFDGTVV
jgi:hypothetical protein